jgi:hypothetical protein
MDQIEIILNSVKNRQPLKRLMVQSIIKDQITVYFVTEQTDLSEVLPEE